MQHLHGRRRAVGILAMFAAALLFPAAAFADTGGGNNSTATVTISGVKVIAKVVAEVKVNVVCNPIPTIDPYTGEPTTTTSGFIENAGVSLLQAQGRVVASGSGGFSGQLTCDGSTVNAFSADVPAASLPWKSGSAVASAFVFALDQFGYGATSGVSGNVVVKLSTK
jgi:hypothetical protein